MINLTRCAYREERRTSKRILGETRADWSTRNRTDYGATARNDGRFHSFQLHLFTLLTFSLILSLENNRDKIRQRIRLGKTRFAIGYISHINDPPSLIFSQRIHKCRTRRIYVGETNSRFPGEVRETIAREESPFTAGCECHSLLSARQRYPRPCQLCVRSNRVSRISLQLFQNTIQAMYTCMSDVACIHLLVLERCQDYIRHKVCFSTVITPK